MKSTCPKKQEVEVQEMVDIAKLRLIVEILPSIVSHQPVEANGGKLNYISSNLVKSVKQMTYSYYLCPKNLTLPGAEREQRCPCLVVVIFCLFFSICQSDLSFAGVNQSNS